MGVTDQVLQEEGKKARNLGGRKLSLEEFAEYLNLPVTETLQDVFALFEEVSRSMFFKKKKKNLHRFIRSRRSILISFNGITRAMLCNMALLSIKLSIYLVSWFSTAAWSDGCEGIRHCSLCDLQTLEVSRHSSARLQGEAAFNWSGLMGQPLLSSE